MSIFECEKPVEKPLFFNRSEELETLISAAIDTENGRGRRILIVGCRRIGKSSLIKEFMRICGERKLKVDFLMLSLHTVVDYKTLVRELKKFLDARVYNPLKKFYRRLRDILRIAKVDLKILKFEPEKPLILDILRNYMTGIAKYSEKNPIILVVEEFQRVQYIEEFSWILKGLSDDYPTFTFILTGSEYSLVEKATSTTAGLFGVPTTIHLRPIGKDACLNFLRERYVEGGYTFELEALEEIVKLSGGHPWILQKIGERTLRYGKKITIEVVRKAAEDVEESIFDLLTVMFNDLNESEKDVLAILPTTSRKVALRFGISTVRANIILRNLVMKGFIRRDAKGTYNYLNPYVERFCKDIPILPLRKRGKKKYEIVLEVLKKHKVADSKTLSYLTGLPQRTVQGAIRYLKTKGYNITTERKGRKYNYIYEKKNS